MSAIPKNFTDGTVTVSDAGGNSATLQVANGDFSLTGLKPEGRNVNAYQSRGSVAGIRKTDRALPAASFGAIMTDAMLTASFKEVALGMVAGFVSTSVALGDAPCVNLTFNFDYLAESHEIVMEDVNLSVDMAEGDPSTDSYSCEIYGDVTFDGASLIPTP